MTVAELIAKLQSLDPSLLVLGMGYESGYDPINLVVVREVVHDPGYWWDGMYRNYSDGDDKPIKALVLSGRMK